MCFAFLPTFSASCKFSFVLVCASLGSLRLVARFISFARPRLPRYFALSWFAFPRGLCCWFLFCRLSCCFFAHFLYCRVFCLALLGLLLPRVCGARFKFVVLFSLCVYCIFYIYFMFAFPAVARAPFSTTSSHFITLCSGCVVCFAWRTKIRKAGEVEALELSGAVGRRW